MQKITYINSNGDSIEFSHQPPFILSSIEGLGDVEADVQTQKSPKQDGSTHIATELSERYINMEISILGNGGEDISEKRSFLSRVLNPKLNGVLIYENGRIKREIKCASEHVPKFPKSRSRTSQISLVNLICPNPYWLDQQKTDQLVVWEGGLEFPLELPTFFAELSNNKSKILVNDGDVETPIFITFNGPATAPIRITNVTTEKFIEVNQSLLDGERLEINTIFGQKRVTKVLSDGTHQNAFHYIKIPGSEFFGLEVGNNLIDYSTGADYESAGVTISWNDRFVGV
nr:phage tail family protein [Fredinandcohnia onubensis]